MKPTMMLTAFKPVNGDNISILGMDYKEEKIPFGQTIDFVPYSDFLNLLKENEELRSRSDLSLRPMFKYPHRAAVFEGMHDSIKKIIDDLMTLEEAHYSLSMLHDYIKWKTKKFSERSDII